MSLSPLPSGKDLAPPPLTGGRVLPLPPEPLPERDGQQPAEGLLPRRAEPELHAAAAAGPGEDDAGSAGRHMTGCHMT